MIYNIYVILYIYVYIKKEKKKKRKKEKKKKRNFPNLQYLLNYFKYIASISNKLGISIPFLKKDLLNLSIYLENKFHSIKQTRALIPNLVNFLNAASLALLK